jgi:enoyl-CoA hydratase
MVCKAPLKSTEYLFAMWAYLLGVGMPDVLVERIRPEVALVTLNRPDRLNALTQAMLEELFGIFEDVGRDPDCRVIILTGAGRGFCAGHDLKVKSDRPTWLSPKLGPVEANMLHQKYWATMVPRMRAVPQPIIAAINGPVAGGGYPLVLGADIRIASETAVFVDAFLKIGISGCEMGLSWLLPRIIGFGNAADLMLTGRRLDAQEAFRMGLVIRVVANDELLDSALTKADEITSNTPFGVWMTKETMWSTLESPSLAAAIDLEARTQILGLTTDDQKEQLAAFLERRTPHYDHH